MNKRTRTPLAVVLAASSALLVLAPGASADEGRDFSAFYDLGEATEMGDEVAVSVTLEIFNHSPADVHDANLILEDELLLDEQYGTAWAGFLGSHESVTASAELVVPLWVYEGWLDGLPPTVTIEFTDAAGDLERTFVELAFMSLVGEE